MTPRKWQSLRKLQIPPKIKDFLWRACKDILSGRERLISRRVVVQPECNLCWGEGRWDVCSFIMSSGDWVLI